MHAVASQPPSLFYLPFRPALDANGIVAPGARLFFFLTQTSIPQKIYADAALTIELENPVGANAAGVWPSIYMDPSLTYRVVLKDQDGVTLNEVDPYRPGVAGEGEKGDTGPANSTYTTLAGLKAAAVSNASYIFAPPSGSDGGAAAGTFLYQTAGAPYTADNANIIKLDAVPLTIGALVRQAAAGVNFDGRSVNAKLLENASVTDARFAGGAKMDGVTDDSAAFIAALSAARNIYVPPGRTYVRNVKVPSGRRIYGAGKSAWEPYTGTEKPAIYLTEVVVDGTDAFDCRNTNSVTIEGMGFASKNGKQSAYRTAPGFQPSTGAVSITGTSQFQMRDVSFFGLDIAVHSHLSAGSIPGGGSVSGVETDEANASANTTQMPSISDWQASDCRRVFQFGNSTSTAYTARDLRISNEVIALHCGGIIEAHWCDGVRLENVRLYQCTDETLYLRKSVFLSITSATLFENALTGIRLDQCENTLISSSTTARTGFYATPSPGYPQRPAITMTGCIMTKIDGLIEKPTGALITADECTGTAISIAGDTPFWLTGNATNESGAINLTNCVATSVAGTITGEGHWINVFADEVSARTLTGAVASYRSTGMTRAAHLQQKGGYVFRLAQAMQIGAGGALPFNGLQEVVPAGKRLVTRCVEITASEAQLRVVDNNDPNNAIIWQMTPQTFGSFSLETRNLYNNTGSADVMASVELTLRNPTGSVITLPIGTEIRISTAII